MKKFIHFGFLAFFCALSFAVQAAEKATAAATPLEELNYKYEKLIQLDYQRHNEVIRMLREIREQGVKKAEANVIASAPVATESAQATPSQATEPAAPIAPATSIPPPSPPAVTPEAQLKPAVAEAAAAPVDVVTAPSAEPTVVVASATPATPPAITEAQPMPQTVAPEVQAAMSDDSTKKLSKDISNANSFAILAFLVSVISLISMGVLIATVRKSDEKIRRMLWKSEVDHLRDEVISGRPQLKVEKSYDRLILTNVGAVVADEIKLSLGPAPRTMKQRLRVLARIEANEKAEVEIGPQQATDGQIYGTLEYKNPENAKLFKEQFILKVDGVTGELVPVQQAI